VAYANKQWTHRAVQSEEAAHQSAQALESSPFVLYSLRHTFLTRLGQSAATCGRLARIAGHSSIAISARYVHPSEDAVLTAMARLGGHNSGHSEKLLDSNSERESRLTA
jgi:integrase